MTRRWKILQSIARLVVFSAPVFLLFPVWAAGAHVVLELEISAPQADDLAVQMQQVVDRVRGLYGLTPATARADGVGIYPRVLNGRVVGYSAVNRLSLPVARVGRDLARIRAVAADATVTVIPRGTAPRRGDTWEDQWQQFG